MPALIQEPGYIQIVLYALLVLTETTFNSSKFTVETRTCFCSCLWFFFSASSEADVGSSNQRTTSDWSGFPHRSSEEQAEGSRRGDLQVRETKMTDCIKSVKYWSPFKENLMSIEIAFLSYLMLWLIMCQTCDKLTQLIAFVTFILKLTCYAPIFSALVAFHSLE